MTQDRFPVGPQGDDARLLAMHDGVSGHHHLAQMRSAATSLALDIQEELRDDEIDLLAYWHILLKRRWVVLGILTGVVAVALLITLLTTPQYRASVLLELQQGGHPSGTGGGRYTHGHGALGSRFPADAIPADPKPIAG